MLDIQLHDLPAILLHINADDRDVWFKVGNGLKTEFGEDAYSHWDTWSQSAETYNRKDARGVWDSLAVGKCTLGTVIYLAQQTGWKPNKRDLTPAEKRQLKQEQEQRRAEREAQIEADTAKRETMQGVVAKNCLKIWENFCHDFGESEYLKKKQVGGFGIRFFHQSVLLWIDDDSQSTGVLTGGKIMKFFDKLPKPRPDHISFLFFKKGTIVIPLRDVDGKLWSLQAISATDKLFPKYGRKAGLYHIIGNLTGATVVAFAEGYATGASIHMATEWPVVVAFDAGNLVSVAATVRKQCPDAKLLICADLDENGKGQAKAHEAASASGAAVVLPDFGDVQTTLDVTDKQARSL